MKFYALILYLTLNLFHYVRLNTVSVTLDSKWQNTPLICESSEYFASKSLSSFWNYISELNKERDSFSLDNTELENHNILTKVSKNILPNTEMAILQLSLALRSYSPSVEMNVKLDDSMNCPTKLAYIKYSDKIFCELNQFQTEFQNIINSNDKPAANLTLFKNDKIFPVIDSISNIPNNSLVFILYGDLRDKSTYEWNDVAQKLTKNKNVFYVFRHRVLNVTTKARLSGYGVELAIKSTEYKAVDDTKFDSKSSDLDIGVDLNYTKDSEYDEVQGFIFSKLHELHPSSANHLEAFRRHLLSSETTDILPLKAWQIQDLSLKAGQFIMSTLETNQALQTLRDLSQNYPSRAHFLANNVQVLSQFREEHEHNHRLLLKYNVQPGQSLILFNGYVLSEDLDVFEIVNLARREIDTMNRLHDFGLSSEQIASLTKLQMFNEQNMGTDSFLLDMSVAPVVYVNNLEKDSRYKSWPSSVRDLLQPTYPGVMRRIAKNLFNVVLVLDPIAPESRDYIKFVEAFVIHMAPVRMGFIWSVDPNEKLSNAPGRALIRAFNFVAGESEDFTVALGFMTDFYSNIEEDESSVSVDSIKQFLKEKYPDVDLDIVFGEKSDYDDNVKASWKYLHDSGIHYLDRPFLLFNGKLADSKKLTEQGFEETVVNSVMMTTPDLQSLVVNNKLVDGIDVLALLGLSDYVVARFNPVILDDTHHKYLGFTKSHNFKLDELPTMSNENITTFVADQMKYMVNNDDYSIAKQISIWLVFDAGSAIGLSHLNETLKWLHNSINCRVGLVLNPSQDTANHFNNHLLYNIINKLAPDQIRLVLVALLSEELPGTLSDRLMSYLFKNPDIQERLGNYQNVDSDYMKLDSSFVSNVIKVQPGNTIVIANGKVLGTFPTKESLLKNDFKMIERGCMGSWRILSRLMKLFGKGADKTQKLSELTQRIFSSFMQTLTGAGANRPNSFNMVDSGNGYKKMELSEELKDEFAGFTLMGNSNRPAFDLTVILDPLSRQAQKLSQIILVLKETLNINVRVLFNCREKLSEPPLKSYYRFVMDPSPVVKDESGNVMGLSSPRGHFSRLPGTPLLTLGLEPIHNWLVESVKSPHDLDNLKFDTMNSAPGTGEISRSVHAQFELEYLLLEGHCIDLTTGQPPRGLQFELLSTDGSNKHDTIVMANLGYFQLKANPGAFNLQLREGKSKDIYTIVDHEFTDNNDKSNNVVAVLDNFRSKIIRIRVNKKADKLKENLLSESKLDEDTTSIWSSISNAFGNTKSLGDSNETINIFSVASGHLYERFLRIMMISVLKNTKSKVKFWFLKNYLSPTFKQFIPHMAKHYGFEYDLVQYKWPRWLHEQTEKQRIIWGYKILFLDVLFPLNVNKIIFVDADQIVRTDLKELVDLDLEGAPYGYTPFCNSRPEMDGFRFWKSGYWNMHLAGRPYHISALYVVDLIRFRQMAAGDRLRGQYHGLSQDPNSLSNLDQDLPNNMIHQVPIKSLPQEWLWCETWCSNDTKKYAKTIDLCNNPQTKEPKLSAAMRILPEWKGYDEEIKALFNRFNGRSTIPSTTSDVPASKDTSSSSTTKTQVPHSSDEL